MESRALVLMLCLIILKRQHKFETKVKAMSLLKHLLDKVMGSSNHSLDMLVPDHAGQWELLHLAFEKGITGSLAALIGNHKQGSGKWKHLTKQGCCNHKVTSTIDNATVFDLVVWLIHCKSCASTSTAWQDIGQILWPKIFF